MRHHSSPYEPLTVWRRALRLHPFRTVRLNFVGWSALLAVITTVGGAAGAITGQVPVGVIVAGLVLMVAVAFDRGAGATPG